MQRVKRHDLISMQGRKIVGIADAGPATLRDGSTFATHRIVLDDGQQHRVIMQDGFVVQILRPHQIVGEETPASAAPAASEAS